MTDKPQKIKIRFDSIGIITYTPIDLTMYGEYIAVHESTGIANSPYYGKYTVTHIPTGRAFNTKLTKRRAHKLAKIIADNVDPEILRIKTYEKFRNSFMGRRVIADDKAFKDFKRLLWFGR